MSTRSKDIPSNQENQDNSESSEDQTPQTTIQENQRIEYDPQYVESLEARIAEQQIQNRRLENLIESVKDSRSEIDSPRTRNIEEERNQFYQDPTGTLDARLNERDARILEEMKKMLNPLHEVAAGFRFNSEYDRLKLIMKNDPVFGKGLRDPDVEGLVDTIMKNPGVTVNEDTMRSAIAQAMGMKAMGGIGTRRNMTRENNDNDRIDPPVIPTSRHRTEAPKNENKPLTENDRLAMKIAGLKPDNPEHVKQYWELISSETMTLSVHKEKKGS